MRSLCLWVCVAVLSARAADAAPQPGQQAPEIKLAGSINHPGPLSLKAARGKVVLLEFWATWCPPCRMSIPHLQALYQEYRGKGLFIIAVTAESKSKVEAFVKQKGKGMTYPIGIDLKGQTTRLYGVRGIPTAFLIDPKGEILWRGHPLALRESRIENALKAVQAAPATKNAKPAPAAAKAAAPAAAGEEAAFKKLEDTANREIARPRSRAEYGQFLKNLAKKSEDTVAEADKFLAAYPKSKHAPEATYKKAYSLCMLGNLKRDPSKTSEGAKLFESLAGSSSADVASRSHLMLAYVKQRSAPKEAVKHANQAAALAKDPKVAAEALYAAGRLNEISDQEDAAKAAYKELIKKYPDSRQARMAKGRLSRLTLKGSVLTGLKFKALDGTDVDIANYRGKVVLIDFWATWCGPCRAELPNVIKAYKKFKKSGFEIIGVSLDRDKSRLEAFIQKNGMTWPQYFDGKGWSNEIARKYGINSIPSTFLLDRKGVVRAVGLRGPRLEREIEKLLKEK